MINYLGEFSSKFSGLCAPIYVVLGKCNDTQWQSNQQAASDAMKREISSTAVSF
jgi:hypothetical protein